MKGLNNLHEVTQLASCWGIELNRQALEPVSLTLCYQLQSWGGARVRT